MSAPNDLSSILNEKNQIMLNVSMLTLNGPIPEKVKKIK